jgi:type I restriction enzyme S subunit
MTPELRFPDFKDPWQDATAGDAFAHSKAKGGAGLPIWSVTLNRGMVPRNSLDRHMESDAADETNLRAKPGDLVYNMMRMWQGAVGQASEECMVSPAYVVLSPKPRICSRFFDYWFKAPHMLHRLRSFSHGLTKDRLRLYYADFAKIPIPLPSEDEQRKIADFMDTVSERITLLNREKAALEDHKQGLMQRLFSQELRFTRRDGSAFPEWQERSLGDIATFRKGSGIAKSEISKTGKVPCIHYGDLFRNHGTAIKRIDTFTDIDEGVSGSTGDVLMPASDVTPTGLCTASALMESGVKLGGDIIIIRPKEEIDSVWLAYAIVSDPQKILRMVCGIAVKHLYSRDLSKLKIRIPSVEEQRKISDAVGVVESKIDAVSTQITHMETFKKGLLQKLFV